MVAGYGLCGKGIAMRAKGLGARVIVTEVDPVKALEASMDGFRVMQMIDAAPIGDLFITATGCKDVITARELERMKDGAICCNAGHFDVEVDVAWLRANAFRRSEARQNIEAFTFKSGRTVYVLGEGRLVNLAAGDGQPPGRNHGHVLRHPGAQRPLAPGAPRLPAGPPEQRPGRNRP